MTTKDEQKEAKAEAKAKVTDAEAKAKKKTTQQIEAQLKAEEKAAEKKQKDAEARQLKEPPSGVMHGKLNSAMDLLRDAQYSTETTVGSLRKTIKEATAFLKEI